MLFLELYFHQQVMTVVFVYGKLHQVMFGDQLGVWVWSKRKKRLSNRNIKMSRWIPKAFLAIDTNAKKKSCYQNLKTPLAKSELDKRFQRAQQQMTERIVIRKAMLCTYVE